MVVTRQDTGNALWIHTGLEKVDVENHAPDLLSIRPKIRTMIPLGVIVL